MTDPLISVRALSKSFSGPDGRPVPALDGITLDVGEGEFVALLGRSGSGKSTLLRCIVGLIAPSDGEVLFRGKRPHGCNRDTSMVFQTFAPLPWLTVQQNVEIGLEARGVAPAQRTERALRRPTWWAWTAMSPPIPRNCPAACASASASPGPSSVRKRRC